MASTVISRRQFLVAGSAVTGSFVLGLPIVNIARAELTDGTFGERQIGYFVEITPKGKVIIGSNQPEIGQGLRTALPMMVAEELDVGWDDVSIRQMPLGILKTADGYTWKYGGQGVGGSTGLTSNWQFMREVGATARHQLIRAAAERLGVSSEACSTRPGYVVCDASNSEIAYADLIEDAAQLDMPDHATPLKAMRDYRIIGTRRDTIDALDIVTGRSKFGLDTQVEGMRYAVIERSPILKCPRRRRARDSHSPGGARRDRRHAAGSGQRSPARGRRRNCKCSSRRSRITSPRGRAHRRAVSPGGPARRRRQL